MPIDSLITKLEILPSINFTWICVSLLKKITYFLNLLKVTVTKTIVFFDIKLNIIMVHYLYLYQCTYEIIRKIVSIHSSNFLQNFIAIWVWVFFFFFQMTTFFDLSALIKLLYCTLWIFLCYCQNSISLILCSS